MTNKTNNPVRSLSLGYAIQNGSLGRDVRVAVLHRLGTASVTEYLTAQEISQWLHDHWVDHPMDLLEGILDALAAEGIIRKGKPFDDCPPLYRMPDARRERFQAGSNQPPAACGCCGGWTRVGGMSHKPHADLCCCDPSRPRFDAEAAKANA